MLPGKKIVLNGEDYILPALSLKSLKTTAMAQIREHDKFVEANDVFSALIVAGQIIHTALLRNYPDLTEDFVLEHIDTETVKPMWLKVLGLSGFSPEMPSSQGENSEGNVSREA